MIERRFADRTGKGLFCIKRSKILMSLLSLAAAALIWILVAAMGQSAPAEISIQEGTVSGIGLSFTLENVSDYASLKFGHGYVIEQWSVFGWSEFRGPTSQTTTSELLVLNPGEHREYTVDWSMRYGELPLGWYRIGKEIEAEACDGGNVPVEKMVYAEFFIWP